MQKVICENFTNQIWELPYPDLPEKSFKIYPKKNVTLEIFDPKHPIYGRYAKLSATQNRNQEQDFSFSVAMTTRKDYKPPYRTPDVFVTVYHNRCSDTQIQRFWISEFLTIICPLDLPIEVEHDLMSTQIRFSKIEKIETSRKIFTTPNNIFADVKSRTIKTIRPDEELKRIWELRNKMKAGEYLPQTLRELQRGN